MSSLVATGSANTTAPELVLVTAPTVTTGGTVTAITSGGALTIDAGATVADTSGQLIAGATITIVGSQPGDTMAFNNGGTLTFADGNKVAGSFNAGTLTLSGNATAADYQAALDQVKFATTSNTATPRTIDWTVTDGVVSSAIGTSTVQVHVLPTVTAGATATFKGGGGAVQLDPALTVTDPSSATLANATVSIGAGFLAGDVLGVTDQNGITGSYNAGTGVLTLTGTSSVANYQAALESVTYNAGEESHQRWHRHQPDDHLAGERRRDDQRRRDQQLSPVLLRRHDDRHT